MEYQCQSSFLFLSITFINKNRSSFCKNVKRVRDDTCLWWSMTYLKHDLEHITPKPCYFSATVCFSVRRNYDCRVISTFCCRSCHICAMICTRSYRIISIPTSIVNILIASVNRKQWSKLKMKKILRNSLVSTGEKSWVTVCFRLYTQNNIHISLCTNVAGV